MLTASKQPERRRRFEELALPHTDALYGMALRLLGNGRDAEDLVQDTLLRAYQCFGQFEGDQRCKAWLFRILMNTFVNKYRRRVLEQRVHGTLEQAGDGTGLSAATLRAREPEAALEGPLLSDDVQRALQTLPEEFRLAVLLCDVEEFSYREIADIMQCPVGTVMSRLYRGRRLLMDQLRDYAGAPDTAPRGRGDGPGAVLPLRSGRGGEG